VHWCKTKGLAARPLDLVGYGDEDEGEATATTGQVRKRIRPTAAR